MAQDSLSSTTQSIGNAGPLSLTCLDATGGGNNVVVQFNATYARIVTPQYAAFQHVNRSLEGGYHIFRYSTNESLFWPIEFANLPSLNLLTDPREQSMGVLDLLSFIRVTLDYSASTCIAVSPDGYIETVRYLDGITSLAEADAGQRNTAQRALRWAGTINFTRVIGV